MNNAAAWIQPLARRKESSVEKTASCGQVVAVDSEPRSAMLRALSHEFPEKLDSVAIAGGLERVLEDIRTVLSPVVGSRGVAALLQRSLQVASHQFASIPTPSGGEDGVDLHALQAAIASQDPAAARAAVEGVFNAFYDLLTSLIGVPLTERLFDSVWASPPSGNAAQEPKP
jgi:hypothetical protein